MFQKLWGIEKFYALMGYHNFPSKSFVSQCRKLLWATLQCFRKIGVSKNFMHLWGITIFRRKFFCLTVPKKFVMESYCFWENFWFQKVLWMKKRVSRFCFWNFWSHSAEKFRGQPLNVSEKFGYWKNLCILAGITFSRRNFLVSQCRKISWASPQCFRKIGILKNAMHTRGYHVFPSKPFGLTVPKKFVGIPSIFRKIWGIENFYALIGYHNFPSKIFVSQCRKRLWASLQCFRKIEVLKNFLHYGEYHSFLSKIFCLTVPKNFEGIPSMFQNIWCIEKFYV